MIRTLIVTIPFLLLNVSAAPAQNLLLDPSFDLSEGGTQTNPHWSLEVNRPDGTGPSAQFQDAPWASNPLGTPGVGVWLKAFEGNQAGGGDPLASATLYQDVTAPAGDYALSFYFRKEDNYTAQETFVELLDDGERIGLFDLTNVDTGGGYEQFSLSGVTDGGTLRVQAKMVDGVDAMVNPQSAMFDDFDLTVVPEPGSAFLTAMGAIALMLGSRSRRV